MITLLAILSAACGNSGGGSDLPPLNGPGGAPTAGAAGAAGATGTAPVSATSGRSGGPTSGLSSLAGNAGASGKAKVGSVGTSGISAAVQVPGAAGSGGTTVPSPDLEPTLIGDVAVSTPSQSFKGSITVALSTAIAGAEIRYTTDGQLPSASSPSYSGQPIALSATTQLRAQAFVGGAPSGTASTALYVARTIDAESDLPIMIVDGYGTGKPCDKKVYLDAAVMIWEPVDGVASLASLPTLAARAGYHARGQSSMAFPQLPLKIELWDNANKDLDYPVLGMPADSDWALVPPYYDRTLIRNPFTYALGKDMGMEAPREAYAEVYLNYADKTVDEADYQGIYWVSETIKNNKVRTNLKSLKETDTGPAKISGGYIFKFDQMAAEEPKLTCSGSNPLPGMTMAATGGGGNPWGGGAAGGGAWGGGAAVPATTPAAATGCPMPTGSFSFSSGTAGTCWIDLEVVDPDPLSAEQKTWLNDYVQKLHDSLHQTPIGDYSTFIDIPSFVDYFIISELTLNVDAYTKSAYYFKDRDQKLKAGPLWDYNFALGGVGAQNATPQSTSETGWRYNGNRDVNNWYPMLMTDGNFRAQVKKRFQELRTNLLSETAIVDRINTLSSPLKEAIVRDYAKWPVSSVVTSSTGFFGGPTTPTWEGQLKVMKDYLLARLTWMDANLK